MLLFPLIGKSQDYSTGSIECTLIEYGEFDSDEVFVGNTKSLFIIKMEGNKMNATVIIDDTIFFKLTSIADKLLEEGVLYVLAYCEKNNQMVQLTFFSKNNKLNNVIVECPKENVYFKFKIK